MDIKIRLDGDGMGEGSTYADAQAYAEFVERRLGDLYPGADIDVELAREGQTVSDTVVLDETDSQDVTDVMQDLWEEFCGDTSLWPSTTPTA